MKEIVDDVSSFDFFPSTIYVVSKPEFLADVTAVSEEKLKDQRKNKNDIYPVVMSGDLLEDERVREFSQYVLQMSWEILADQGYAIDLFTLGYTEFWTQEHYKGSGMDYHTHSNFSQLIGFYVLDAPETGSDLILHDPRTGKVQIDLPEKDPVKITKASSRVFMKLKKGDLILTNAYIPHSFTRNMSNKPVRFVHMNVMAIPTQLMGQSCQTNDVEVV